MCKTLIFVAITIAFFFAVVQLMCNSAIGLMRHAYEYRISHHAGYCAR